MTQYICPACQSLGKIIPIKSKRSSLFCSTCESSLKTSNDPKIILLSNKFMFHSKSGFRCKQCSKFLPESLAISNLITCPYLDCTFVGPHSSLPKMNHPTTKSNISEFPSEIQLSEKAQSIINVIQAQKQKIYFSNSESTLKQKSLIYDAFEILLKQNSELMCNYLIDNSRSGGFQNLIFKTYVSLLEKDLPFFILKNKKRIKIESLLDDELSIFDGISEFESKVINDKIRNQTNEIYIGKVSKPYYIGKLLSLNDVVTGESYMKNVVNYTFNYIKTKDVPSLTNVKIKHLRVKPHYQLGAMSYINRIRKSIIEDLK
jgi:hypothetical protein